MSAVQCGDHPLYAVHTPSRFHSPRCSMDGAEGDAEVEEEVVAGRDAGCVRVGREGMWA